MMPNAPPPWYTVYQQTQRWLKAGVFATLVHDLRAPPCPPRRGGGKGGRAPARFDRLSAPPRAAIVDARTMQSPPCPPAPLPPCPPRRGGKGGGQGGGRGGAARAGDDGHQRPPLSPPPACGGGKGGAARSTWLKRFITFMLEST